MTKHGLTVEERFWLYVDRRADDECWPWLGGRSEGYGRIYVRRENGRAVEDYAHRVAFTIGVGQIPLGHEVDHTCTRRDCVNWAHLEAVTGAENKSRQGQRQTHCIHGHEYTEENTYRQPDGRRRCRQCARVRRVLYS